MFIRGLRVKRSEASDVEAVMRKSGGFLGVNWVEDRTTGHFYGTGFASFADYDSAKKVVDLSGIEINGRKIEFSFALLESNSRNLFPIFNTPDEDAKSSLREQMSSVARGLYDEMKSQNHGIIFLEFPPIPGALYHEQVVADMYYNGNKPENATDLSFDEVTKNEDALNLLFSWGISTHFAT